MTQTEQNLLRLAALTRKEPKAFREVCALAKRLKLNAKPKEPTLKASRAGLIKQLWANPDAHAVANRYGLARFSNLIESNAIVQLFNQKQAARLKGAAK